MAAKVPPMEKEPTQLFSRQRMPMSMGARMGAAYLPAFPICFYLAMFTGMGVGHTVYFALASYYDLARVFFAAGAGRVFIVEQFFVTCGAVLQFEGFAGLCNQTLCNVLTGWNLDTHDVSKT